MRILQSKVELSTEREHTHRDLDKITCPRCKVKAQEIQRMRQGASSLAFSPDSDQVPPGGDGGNDGGLDRAKVVAARLGLKSEVEDNVLYVYFPKTKYSYIPAKNGKPGAATDPKTTAEVTPILVTQDGKSWTPDFDFNGEPGWVGAIDLVGKRLKGEVQRMVTRCQLGTATQDKMFEYLNILNA